MIRMVQAVYRSVLTMAFFVFPLLFLFGKENEQPAGVQLFSVVTSEIKGQPFAHYIVSPAKAKICLNMIVKNESKIIERCLESTKNIVDCISICDTGSTDNTVEIIENFMKKYNIPGKVHRHEWKNFGYNRTLSAQVAKQTLQELGFSLPDTYLLLLDADMVLKVDSLFKQIPFIADSYLIMQKTDRLSFHNRRLLRAALPWESIGVTHEYWACALPTSETQLETLTIEDQEDGGCKADKHPRDIKLLTEALKEDPHNSRHMFYLALTYAQIKNYNEAIKWFKARLQEGGLDAEKWYSKLMIGEIYEELGFWNDAMHWYLEAYQDNPTHAEPLHKMAIYYRKMGKNQLAYLFAKEGSKIPKPHIYLFIHDRTYDYQLDEELSITAFYTPFKEDGFAAANRIILKKGVPQEIKDQTLRNILFYVNNLPNAQFQPLKIELPLIREGMQERYDPMNSAILKTDQGYIVLCRTVNYDRNLHFQSRDPLDSAIRSRNFLIYYDRDFNVLSQKELIENFPRLHGQGRVLGLEDCRFFTFNQQRWVMCATFGTHSHIGQTICKLANDSSDPFVKVEKFIPLKMPNPFRHEKNWLPFVKDNELCAIYSYDPFIIYKIDMDSGNYETKQQVIPTQDFARFRGSAAPIEFDDGYLVLLHEALIGTQDHYLHRFMFLNKELQIKKLSKPFMFKHKGVEYCIGMTLDHSGTKCIMPISIEDKEAWICSVPVETIRSLLEPLPI